MIRRANIKDLESIMEIVRSIEIEMKEENNPQWHEGYPTNEDFLHDINDTSLFVYEDIEIIGFICIKKDIENEYDIVPKSTRRESYIMHRLGVSKKHRHEGIAYKLMSYGEVLAKADNVYLMKADTEKNNIKMQGLFKKLGYSEIDTFHWSDNDGTFIYYEKELKK